MRKNANKHDKITNPERNVPKLEKKMQRLEEEIK